MLIRWWWDDDQAAGVLVMEVSIRCQNIGDGALRREGSSMMPRAQSNRLVKAGSRELAHYVCAEGTATVVLEI